MTAAALTEKSSASQSRTTWARRNEISRLEMYPRLTIEMLRVAPIYAAAYPQRGRPRVHPWHRQPPTHRVRRKLATIQAA